MGGSHASTGCGSRFDRRIFWRPLGAGRPGCDIPGAPQPCGGPASQRAPDPSPHGGFTLTPKLVTASDLAAAGGIDLQFDAILLTVKSYALEAALDDLAPAVGPDTMILPVLNGMRHMDIVTARFGKQALAGCVCRIAAKLDEEGRIVELETSTSFEYGELDGAGPSASCSWMSSCRTPALARGCRWPSSKTCGKSG